MMTAFTIAFGCAVAFTVGTFVGIEIIGAILSARERRLRDGPRPSHD